MPGKCKFQESWLSKVIYKDWLEEDPSDIHSARCRACVKSIKLQTMGEAALTSHAGGVGHKAAVRELLRGGDPSCVSPAFLLAGNTLLINAAGQVNGGGNRAEDSKDNISLCLQRDALDRVTGSEWSDLSHISPPNSTSHHAELQDVTFPSALFTVPGISRRASQRLSQGGSGGCEAEEGGGRRSSQHDPLDLLRLEQQQRTEALEQQQQQMKIMEWESRMKTLAWEQELVREKRKATAQKTKAFRMKTAYYKAKLRRMGEDVPPSSSSGSDNDEQKTSDLTG